MLDFNDGVRDLVKRIDNVTIQLAGLFCCLENELLELYQLCGSGSERGGNGLKKSEFIEGMRELLSSSVLNGQDSIGDEYLIALDNSLMSLETLTSVLVGTKCYVNCKVVNEDQEKNNLEGISSAIENCNELGLTEINENSSLIRLCRSITRLTKHRNNIERYDVEMNSELENIKEEKTRELEAKLKEMEIKLRSKEALCYAHEKQIEYLRYDLEELSRMNGEMISQINIQELISEKEREFESNINTDPEKLSQKSYRETSDSCCDNECSNEFNFIDNCSKVSTLRIEPINNFNQAINDKTAPKYESASLQETFREEDLDILELKDQIQILHVDLQFLKEENSRLKLQLENIAEGSEVLYDILQDKSVSEKHTETESDIRLEKPIDKIIENIINVSIFSSLPKLRKVELQKVEIYHSSIPPACQNPKPCLVMWEPIIDSCPRELSSAINTNNNIIPLPMSSYGQFKKSRRDGRKNLVTIVEGTATTRKAIHVNRNSFYCDLEKIVKKNIERRATLIE